METSVVGCLKSSDDIVQPRAGALGDVQHCIEKCLPVPIKGIEQNKIKKKAKQ